ncbi:MAG: helix-turn-helix transcriptional regulator [Pseudonocardiaceae bacterium]
MTGADSADSLADHPELLRAAQVAHALQVSVSTVRAWAQQDKGPPHVRIGSQLRFPASAFEEWFAERQNPLLRAALAAGVPGVPGVPMANPLPAGLTLERLMAGARQVQLLPAGRVLVELDLLAWVTALGATGRAYSPPPACPGGVRDKADRELLRRLADYACGPLEPAF